MSDSDPDDDLAIEGSKRKRCETPEKKKKIRGDSNLKSEHREQRFRKEWESDPRFRAWIAPVKSKATRAYCKCCDKEMNAEESVLKRHAESVGHTKNNKAIGADSGQKTLFQCAIRDPAAVKLETQIKEAEIRKCAFLAENNIAIRTVELMVATDKKCYPDSKIAQGIRLGRTKATKVITNVIGEAHQAELATKLRNTKFSVIIDESTDIGTIKSMAVCVRYHEGEKVGSKFWKLVQVFSGKHSDAANEGATARRLFDLLVKSFVRDYTDLDGKKIFKELGCFALEVLSLPHSNAVCERCFSKINLIKTKLRNRLITETLNGLLLSSQCAKDGGGCDKFQVTPAMIAAMNTDNLKPKKKPAAREPRGIADLDIAFGEGEQEMVEEVIDEGDFDVCFAE